MILPSLARRSVPRRVRSAILALSNFELVKDAVHEFTFWAIIALIVKSP